MHFSRRPARLALAIASAIAITGLAGVAPSDAITLLSQPDLKASSDSGVSSTDNNTNAAALTFTVTGATVNDVVELWRGTTKVATATTPISGALELTDPATVPEGVFAYSLVRGGEISSSTSVTVDRTVPGAPGVPILAPAAPDLDEASDTGKSATDNVTQDSTPTLTQAAVPVGADAVELTRNGASIPSGGNAVTSGSPFTDTLPALPLGDGTYTYASRGIDLAGNAGPASPNLSMRLDRDGSVALALNTDTGRSASDGYTTGLNAAAGNIFAEVVLAFGIDPGAPITWSRTDPTGATVTLAPSPGLVPSTGGVGLTVLTDILSIFAGQPPTNGRWTYSVTVPPVDDAGNFTFVLPMTMVLDTTPPAPPAVDLQTASDTGSSTTDNVTQSQAAGLKLDVTGEADSIVEVFRDGLTVTPPSGPPAVMPCPPALAPVTCPTPQPNFAPGTLNPGTALTMTGFNDTNAATLSAWHGYVAQVTDRAGNVSTGNLPVYIDADAPAAPLQLDLIAEDDHGPSADDNITNVATPRFNVTGAEDGAIIEMTACEGPGCTLVLSLAPFITRSTRTANPVGSANTVVIGSRVGNGVIQADPDWWKKTSIGQLDNYTAGGGPVLPGNAANTSWRFNVRQRDLSGRLGATFSQDLNVVIDTTKLPAPSSPDLVDASDTGASGTDNVTSAVSPKFNVAAGQGRVELLRNGQVVATRTAAGEITDPGPLANGAYSYTTRATDTAGNVSAVSDSLVVVIEHTGGYWLVASDGGVFSFGNAPFFGSLGGIRLNAPVIAIVPTPSHNGYWVLGRDGGVFSFGDAAFFGSTGSMTLNSPIVGMVPTPSGLGYWLFAEDGGVFNFGDAGFFGAAAASAPTSRVVAMRAAPGGTGYWLVTAAGKVYAFGSASAMAGVDGGPINSPIVGMAATPSGRGLWLVGADGGLFALGEAGFFGSMGGERINSPIIGLESVPTGDGYWQLASDGGVFNFGSAPFLGSTGDMRLNRPIVGMGGS